MRVSVSATTRDRTTRSVNVDGEWHRGLGPGSFQEAIPIGLEKLGITDSDCVAIGAEVVEEVLGEVEVTHFCSCGGRFKLTVPADDRLYLKGQRLIKAFTDIHQGEGHRPVDAKECAKVRRRLESQRRAEARAKSA